MKRFCVVVLAVLASTVLFPGTGAAEPGPDLPFDLTMGLSGGEAPRACAVQQSDTQDPDPGPAHVIVHCSGNCGTTNATWSCLNENCCTDCNTNPISPIFGCRSASGVCR